MYVLPKGTFRTTSAFSKISCPKFGQTKMPVSALQIAHCVTLGKELSLSEPPFVALESWDNFCTYIIELLRGENKTTSGPST